jgi:hypothetical protein
VQFPDIAWASALFTLSHGGMSKKYTLEFTVETKSDPRSILDFIQRRIKDALPVISMRYHLIEERPTDVEHHGGKVDDSEEE